MSEKPYIRRGDVWEQVDGFYRASTGWVRAKEIYKKISGSWVRIYTDAVPRPTGTVTMKTTADGRVIGYVENVKNAVKVVQHIGRTMYQPVPMTVSNGYRSGTNYFAVINVPNSTVKYQITHPDNPVVAGTNYYARAWAQDAAGVWHLLGSVRVNVGTPASVVKSVVKKSVVIKPTYYGVWGSNNIPATGLYNTSWHTPNTTMRINPWYRGMFFYGNRFTNVLNKPNIAITGMKVNVNRYPDNYIRTGYRHWLEYHAKGEPTTGNKDGNLYLDQAASTAYSKFTLAQKSTLNLPSNLWGHFQTGKIKSVSLNLEAPSDKYTILYKSGSFDITVAYEERVMGKLWPVHTSVPA